MKCLFHYEMAEGKASLKIIAEIEPCSKRKTKNYIWPISDILRLNLF
jgi:hypothetical protein